MRTLDPFAYARTGIPHVREYVPERALTTWVLAGRLAVDGLRHRGPPEVRRGRGHRAVIARLALRHGGRIGLATCGAATERLVPPRGGRGALAGVRVLDEGVAVDGTVPAMTLADGIRRINRLTRGQLLVVVISNFVKNT